MKASTQDQKSRLHCPAENKHDQDFAEKQIGLWKWHHASFSRAEKSLRGPKEMHFSNEGYATRQAQRHSRDNSGLRPQRKVGRIGRAHDKQREAV